MINKSIRKEINENVHTFGSFNLYNNIYVHLILYLLHFIIANDFLLFSGLTLIDRKIILFHTLL